MLARKQVKQTRNLFRACARKEFMKPKLLGSFLLIAAALAP